MTIEESKQQAQAGFEKAQQDIQAAMAAHADASSRLNYFKGAYEAVCQLEPPPPTSESPVTPHVDQ